MEPVKVWAARLAKSKTIWVNALALASVIFASQEVQAFVSLEHVVMVQSALNLLLRFLTGEPLSNKA